MRWRTFSRGRVITPWFTELYLGNLLDLIPLRFFLIFGGFILCKGLYLAALFKGDFSVACFLDDTVFKIQSWAYGQKCESAFLVDKIV